MNMWVKFLHHTGVSEKSDLFEHEDRDRVISRTEVKGMDLVATQGVAFQLGLKIQKYNYQKGRPEPIDLTGSNAQLCVYDPKKAKFSIQMEIVSPEGKKYTASVDLDPDEADEYFLLKTRAQIEEFGNKVLARRGEVISRSEQTDLPEPNELKLRFTKPLDQSEPKA